MAIGEVNQTMPKDIGGGEVLRPFISGAHTFARGERLTGAQVLAFPLKNRRAMIERGWLRVWIADPTKDAEQEMHIASVGGGNFDVIRGVKIATRVDAKTVFELTGLRVGKMREQDQAAD